MKERFILAILITALTVLGVSNNFLSERISNFNYDLYQKVFSNHQQMSEATRIVNIDEESIKAYGQFPWKRDLIAKLVQNIDSAEPSSIAFDIFFSEEDKQSPQVFLKPYQAQHPEAKTLAAKLMDTDKLLSEQIEKSGKVILPIVGAVVEDDKQKETNLKTNIILKGPDPENFLYQFPYSLSSISSFTSKAKGIGSVSILDSHDGILRTVPMALIFGNQIWPGLAIEALRVANNEKSLAFNFTEAGLTEIKSRSFSVRTDPNGLIHVKYKNYMKENYISAKDVLENNFNKDEVKDKIILIGSSAQGLYDFAKLPNGQLVPGVQIHAHIIENILSNDFIITNLSTKLISVILFILALIVTSVLPNKTKPATSLLFYLALIISIATISLAAYQYNYFISVLFTILASLIVFVISMYFRYLRENEIALENEKKELILKQEREIAGEVQKKFFPNEKVKSEFIYGKNIPARDVSGDFYDYVKINENEIIFILADVSGKGIKAGMLMSNASAIFKAFANTHTELSELAFLINNQVKNVSYKGMFLTAVIGKYFIKENKADIINCGHESIMLVTKDHQFEYLKSNYPPLGITSQKNKDFFKSVSYDLNKKIMFIYTDGVTEGYDKEGKELTVKGIEKIVKESSSFDMKVIIDQIVEQLTHQQNKLRDDLTCLGISKAN